jgi:16S rRNA (guanine527-N7)-methyltransferase
MTDALPDYFELWQKTLNWQPSSEQQALFQTFYSHLVEGNRQLNLTRIISPEDFWEKHLWDSLSGIAPWLSEPAIGTEDLPEAGQESSEVSSGSPSDAAEPLRVIDIGTGGGIPGIPAAIALSTHFPNVSLTLLDATRKKIQFLQQLCAQLGLKATGLADRAEAIGQQRTHREQYDLALIRAVGSAATCAEYALPLLQVGGQAVLYRGQWSTDDTEALMPVIDLLGGELTDIQSWQTPLSQSTRHCLFIYKTAPTPPDLPRAIGVPGKKPLT